MPCKEEFDDNQMSFIKYIVDENHYKEVLSLVGKAKQADETRRPQADLSL